MRELIEMMYQFEEPFVVEHSKFIEAFGDTSTPLTEAIRATIEWYRTEASPDISTGREASGHGPDQKSIE